MKHGNLSIIVPVYIATPKLIQIVQDFITAIDTYYPEAELILVDDCSPIEAPFSDRFAASHKENQGFTATVNTGLQLAGGDMLVIANQDLQLKEGDLDDFLLIDTNDLCIHAVQDSCGTSDLSFGAIWGMTRKTYDLLGNLDERCKHYFSDKLYLRKALQSGVLVMKNHSTIIDHLESTAYNTLDKSALYAADEAIYRSVLFSDGNTN